VFAVVGGAFVPLNFMAVRFAETLVHPKTLSSTENLPGPMALTFLVAVVAMAALFVTLVKYELAAKHTRMQLSRLKRRMAGEATAPLTQRRSAAPQQL
jgi:heme exporter protein C